MFPLGINDYLMGGILIGLGVSLIYIIMGFHATVSSFFSTTFSFFSTKPSFQKKGYLESREWRITFVVGIVFGAFIYSMISYPNGFFITSVQLWRLALGGFLVGFGTRLSQGCTSGHGISGIASLSSTSFYAVITFISIAIIVAKLVQFFGVIP